MASEAQEIKVKVTLPPGGFHRVLFFNRYLIEETPEGELLIMFDCHQPRIQSTLNAAAYIISKRARDEVKNSFAKYLTSLPQAEPNESARSEALFAKGDLILIDHLACAVVGDMAEIALYSVPYNGAARNKGADAVSVQAEPVARLHSTVAVHAQWIADFLKEYASN